mmetsp:Transcript_22619/g.53668  ORF Transcript_22619/g.53668 Transcript_22619/m.53668 type:complete len:89 (-) Transcript_22619:240-506(-)
MRRLTKTLNRLENGDPRRRRSLNGRILQNLSVRSRTRGNSKSSNQLVVVLENLGYHPFSRTSKLGDPFKKNLFKEKKAQRQSVWYYDL